MINKTTRTIDEQIRAAIAELAPHDANGQATVQTNAADAFDKTVMQHLGWPERTREVCNRIWDVIRDAPRENWDEFGHEIEARFDAMLRVLTELRDVCILQAAGQELKNATRLESDIKELRQLKRQILDGWPWSNSDLPPVNQEMVAASMAALNRGEMGDSIDDLISQLSSNANA